MYVLQSNRITVQTFRDHSGATGFPSIKTGSFPELQPWCAEENRKGMGVFYAVNEMRDGRRGREYVEQVKAFFIDVDGLQATPLKDLKAEELLLAELPPNSIVYTKNGVQALWNVHGDASLDPDEYKHTEMGLIQRFAADQNAKDIARVLRMPGTYHLKNPDEPYLCSVMFNDDERVYSEAELREAYPARSVIVRSTPFREYERPPKEGAFLEWNELMLLYRDWVGNPGYRHDSLLIAAGNAVRLGLPYDKALNDLLPIVEGWRDDARLAHSECRGAVDFAFRQGVPYSRTALLNRIR
jgi:hypothetical protein